MTLVGDEGAYDGFYYYSMQWQCVQVVLSTSHLDVLRYGIYSIGDSSM